MALPAIAAGAAKALKGIGTGIGRGISKGFKKPALTPPTPSEEAPEEAEASPLTRPGVIMLFIAILLDLFGIICLILDIFFGLGEIPSWISDGIGIIFISGWMFLKSGKIEAPERTQRGLRKLFRGKWKKFLTPIIGEVAPFVGALPFWSLTVYYELTS